VKNSTTNSATGNAVISDGSVNYINEFKGIKSWLTTLDHKRIGLMYMVCVMFFFLLGRNFCAFDST
jgi:hypothetical protein